MQFTTVKLRTVGSSPSSVAVACGTNAVTFMKTAVWTADNWEKCEYFHLPMMNAGYFFLLMLLKLLQKKCYFYILITFLSPAVLAHTNGKRLLQGTMILVLFCDITVHCRLVCPPCSFSCSVKQKKIRTHGSINNQSSAHAGQCAVERLWRNFCLIFGCPVRSWRKIKYLPPWRLGVRIISSLISRLYLISLW